MRRLRVNPNKKEDILLDKIKEWEAGLEEIKEELNVSQKSNTSTN
jgi:hypothetical protein